MSDASAVKFVIALLSNPIGAFVVTVCFAAFGIWLVLPTEKNGVKEESSMVARVFGGIFIFLAIVIGFQLGKYLLTKKNETPQQVPSTTSSPSPTPFPSSAPAFYTPFPSSGAAAPVAKFGRGRGRRVYRMC